jgi:hypothetical protein
VNLQPNDWVELLPLAEFADNNSITSTHRMTPFYINDRYHPSSGTALPSTSSLPVNSIAYWHSLTAVHEDYKKELQKTSERMKKYADEAQISLSTYETRNLVMINGKNIKTPRPARKFDHKLYGPFEILEVVSPMALRLRLSKT